MSALNSMQLDVKVTDRIWVTIVYLLPAIWPFCSCSSSRIELGDVTPHNIKQLKRLNQVIFPVSYNDKFYKDVLEVGELAKLGKKQHLCILLSNNLNTFFKAWS